MASSILLTGYAVFIFLAYGTTGGQGAAVEVRITRTEEPAGLDSGSTATRCYRFTHDGSQVDQDRIDCDGRAALLLPEMPLPPSLPPPGPRSTT